MAALSRGGTPAQVCVPLPAWAIRAGARETIYFNPAEVNVAIVTCGGLCPGLNDVVQGLVRKLEDYGVPDGNIMGIRCCRGWPVMHAACQAASSVLVRMSGSQACRAYLYCQGAAGHFAAYGCWCASDRYGYKGFYDRRHKPVVLNRKMTEGIQLQGGTILVGFCALHNICTRSPHACGGKNRKAHPCMTRRCFDPSVNISVVCACGLCWEPKNGLCP